MAKKLLNVNDSNAKNENETIVRTPMFPVMAHPILVDVKFGTVDMYIGSDSNQAIPVRSPRKGGSLFNAALLLKFGTKFPVVELGLHLRAPVDFLKKMAICEDAGFLGAEYVPHGANDPLAGLVPEEGFVKLGVDCGQFSGYPLFLKEIEEDMPGSQMNGIAHNNNIVRQHFYMDALLKGQTFHVMPLFRKGDEGETAPTLSLTERQILWIQEKVARSNMTAEELAVSTGEMIEIAQTRRTYAKLGDEDKALVAAGKPVTAPEYVLARDGSKLTFEGLDGKVVREFYGRAKIVGTTKISTETWPVFAKEANLRRHTVEIVEVPAQ
jgi:hypothetical protein